VQAQSYERTFIVSGSVVKVYKKAEADEGRSLTFDMNLPILKNEEGNKIKPCNVMLHNSEGQMIFCDKNDQSQVYNFDMERGKIIE
jgi:superfamily II DNA or RNA helicase